MKYDMMARLYWTVLKGGFERELNTTLGISDTRAVMKRVHKKYREMLESVQPFERKTRFISNIILASILGSVYLSLDKKPDIEKMTVFTSEALMNNRVMLKAIVSERNYTAEGQEKLRREAENSMTDSNPYSWQYTFEAGETLMEYTATFKTCGILHLYRMWGIQELTPAMCRLDYDMAAANNSVFIREQTLAGGGEYCDCHYIHTQKK
ncbi:MAG: L-2-amino-thiazoline-4-carboxylic acid hydrolase [Oscillospiraceae bacterium]|nr:L-2-amino-thiazoline-4-carboxylic acid hydrolase [Oscillospiraceae bacterium]